MASLLKNLEQRFSTTRYLRGDGATDLVRAGGGVREWIVARGLCLYVLIDCANVPAKKRHGFVEIAVRRIAPFPDPECHVVWAPGAAMAWIWPRSRMTPDEDGVPLRSDADAVFPESIFLGAPQASAETLQADSSGVEGRIWRDEVLVASRWWPAVPDLAEWSAFCRGAGASAPDAVPAAAPFELQERPWADLRERTGRAWLQHAGKPATLAAVFLLAAWLAWDVGGLFRLAAARAAVARQSDQLAAQLANILEARDGAVRDATAVDALLSLRPPQRQIVLMARMADLLRDSRCQVVEWAAPERDRIAITLRMPNPNPEALVKLVENSGLLAEVTSDTRAGGELVLSGRVLPPRAVAGGKP